MSSTTNNFSLLGDASADGIAVWISGVTLMVLFGAIIAKSKGSGDLRFLAYCVLAGVFGLLGFAYFSKDDDPPRSTVAEAPHKSNGDDKTQAPTTDKPRPVDEYPGGSASYSSQNAKPSALQSPHARSGVTDQSNGS